MEQITVSVYYLQMFAASSGVVAPPRQGLQVLHARDPQVGYYRYLYDAVGKDYCWLSRRRMPDDELAAIIQNPLVELHVLHVDGAPAGFAELDRREPDEIELKQFGLMGPFLGQGLGKWFLRQVIEQAFQYRPRRFWLHTCSLDHPAALPNYQQSGFELYRTEVIGREP